MKRNTVFIAGLLCLFFLPSQSSAQCEIVVTNPPVVCFPSSVDLTSAAIIAGSTAGLTYSYWLDSTATSVLVSPNNVRFSGTYYIRGEDREGCSVIKAVEVIILTMPTLLVNHPEPVTAPSTVDLTADEITKGSSPGIELTYWTDPLARKVLENPSSVASSGTYYIRGSSGNGCIVIMPVLVTVHSASGIDQDITRTIFDVYPNPNNGTFNIKYQASDQKPFEISILDITGKEVYYQKYTETDKPIMGMIKLPGHLPGLYFVRLIKDNGIIYKKMRVR